MSTPTKTITQYQLADALKDAVTNHGCEGASPGLLFALTMLDDRERASLAKILGRVRKLRDATDREERENGWHPWVGDGE